MGSGVAPQCSGNRCLAGERSGSRIGGRGGGAGRVNSKKELVTGPIRGFCALQAPKGAFIPIGGVTSGFPSRLVWPGPEPEDELGRTARPSGVSGYCTHPGNC
jgi:hypothetical protein